MTGIVTYSDVELASIALDKMGEGSIADFTGPALAQQVMGRNYERVKQTALTATPWRFATTKKALNKLTAAPPERWAAAWQIPADCLSVLYVYPGERYEISGSQIWSNNTSAITLTYIKNTEEGDFPPWFQDYFIDMLLNQTVKAITGDDPSQHQYEALKTSRSVAFYQDAMQQPNQEQLPNPFVDVRW